MTASRQRQSLGSVTCPMKAVTLDLFWARGVEVRVLLVDASPTAATNRACLAAAGYDVQLEQAGRAALAALNQAPFDLIIINWQLPDRDGDELCRTSCAGSVECP